MNSLKEKRNIGRLGPEATFIENLLEMEKRGKDPLSPAISM